MSDPAVVRSRLRSQVRGQLITPRDAQYERARAVFYGQFDQRPAAIVRPADANDVAAVVEIAREAELELAVRSGGHSLAGHSVSDGGVVLDLSTMRALDIDVERRTAWTETGLAAGEYTAAAGARGFATALGDTGSVGLGGITLGGGVGYLSRKHGLTIDSLLAAEVVTADGHVLHVDAEQYPDLFWAIRGGGGNFGVATRFEFRLNQVGTVLGGRLILPASARLIADFVALAEAAPVELSTVATVMPAAPALMPAGQRDGLVVAATLVYAGQTEEGERAVAPFKALATPIADTIRPVRYRDLFSQESGHHPLAATRSMFVDAIDNVSAETILEHLGTSTAPARRAHLRVLGGALARVPVEATAFAHRRRRVMVNLTSTYNRPEDAALHQAWVTGFAAALRGGRPGVYVNFLGDEGHERVREAYPGPTWDRLVAIKSRYDPTNLFRLNQNIPPASRGGNEPAVRPVAA